MTFFDRRPFFVCLLRLDDPFLEKKNKKPVSYFWKNPSIPQKIPPKHLF